MKIHAVVDSKGRPLNCAVTGGQVHDSQVVSLARGSTLPSRHSRLRLTRLMTTKKGFQQIKDEGALPITRSRCNATKKAYCPKRFYRRRHTIENYFCRYPVP